MIKTTTRFFSLFNYSFFKFLVPAIFVLALNSLRSQTISAVQMDMEWLSSTTNTADFQIRLTNTGTSTVTFNALIIRGVHAVNLTSGAISWKALNDNTLPGWLGWPNVLTNLPYITSQRKLNFSSSNGIFTSATAQVIPSGSGVVVGTFRVSTTTSWAPNSDFGFVWEMTSGGVVAYVNGASTVTNIQPFGTVSSATICASCLTLTASSAQPLNLGGVVPPITASVLSVSSANDTICSGASTNLSAVVIGGNPPYTVTVTDGTNNYSATSASPVSISVSPSTTSTYTIVSVSSGSVTGTGNSGSPTVTVTAPALPTFTQVAAVCSGAAINSLPTSSSNNITGTWSPVINNTSTTTYTFTPQVGQCASTTTMTISINSPSVPTFNTPVTPICSGSTLSNISTNGISGTWFPASINASTTTYTFTPTTGQCATSASTTLTGTQSTSSSSAISACGSYTWANTGQTYTTSGTYTGTTVNCQTPILNLTILQSTSNTTTISGCGSYTWPNNGQTFTSSGVYTGSTTNCVTQVLNLTISSGSTSTSPPPACGTYTWANNGQTYSSSGTYISVNSCGTDTLNLTIIPSNNNQTDITICGTSYFWSETGTTYTTSGIYEGPTNQLNGQCYTEILNLTIVPPNTTNTTSITACDSYTWPNNGVTYTTAGTNTYVGLTLNCATELLNLSIIPSSTNTITVSVCDSYTWGVNGITYTSSGFYTESGADCITEALNLTIIPTSINTTTVSGVCASFTWANTGQTYLASGTYTGTTTNCVTQVLNLSITPNTASTTNANACGSYLWANNNQIYTVSGTYTGPTVNCVTPTLILTITPNSTNTTTVSAACGSYTWSNNGITYTSSGVYTGNTLGCITQALNLTIIPSTSQTTTITATDTYTWAANGLTYTVSGIYTGPTSANCITQYLNLTINSSGISEEEMVLFSLYPNPVSEALTIDFNGLSKEEYLIIDNFGSVVKRGVLENMSTKISVSGLSAGLYYFKIEGTKPRKFSKIN